MTTRRDELEAEYWAHRPYIDPVKHAELWWTATKAFRAGYDAGVRDVIEWLEAHKIEGLATSSAEQWAEAVRQKFGVAG